MAKPIPDRLSARLVIMQNAITAMDRILVDARGDSYQTDPYGEVEDALYALRVAFEALQSRVGDLDP